MTIALAMPDASNFFNISISLDKSLLVGTGTHRDPASDASSGTGNEASDKAEAANTTITEIYLVNKNMDQCLGTMKFSLASPRPSSCLVDCHRNPTVSPSPDSGVERDSLSVEKSCGEDPLSSSRSCKSTTSESPDLLKEKRDLEANSLSANRNKGQNNMHDQEQGHLPLRKRSALRPPTTTPLSSPPLNATESPDTIKKEKDSSAATRGEAEPDQRNQNVSNESSSPCKRTRKISIFQGRPAIINSREYSSEIYNHGSPPFSDGSSSKVGINEVSPNNRKCSLFNSLTTQELTPVVSSDEYYRKISALSLGGISFNPDDGFDSLDEDLECPDKTTGSASDEVCQKIKREPLESPSLSTGRESSYPDRRSHMGYEAELTKLHKRKNSSLQSSMSKREEKERVSSPSGSNFAPDSSLQYFSAHGQVNPTAYPLSRMIAEQHQLQQQQTQSPFFLTRPPNSVAGTVVAASANNFVPPPLLHVSQTQNLMLPNSRSCSVSPSCQNMYSTDHSLAQGRSPSPGDNHYPLRQSGLLSPQNRMRRSSGGAALSISSEGLRRLGGSSFSLGTSPSRRESRGSGTSGIGLGGSRLATCDLCPYQAKHPYQIKLHKRNCHSDERPYQCNYCWYASKQRCNLNRHIRQVHRHATNPPMSNSNNPPPQSTYPSNSEPSSTSSTPGENGNPSINIITASQPIILSAPPHNIEHLAALHKQ